MGIPSAQVSLVGHRILLMMLQKDCVDSARTVEKNILASTGCLHKRNWDWTGPNLSNAMKCLRLASFWRLRLHHKELKNLLLACGLPPTGLVQIGIPNLGSNLSPVKRSSGVPPIDLLSVDLVHLVSPNPVVVGDNDLDLSHDLALRKDKELMETLSSPRLSYAEELNNNYRCKYWRIGDLHRVGIAGCINHRGIFSSAVWFSRCCYWLCSSRRGE